jgi:hypothetical protein
MAGLNLYFLSYRSLRCNSILFSERRIPWPSFPWSECEHVRFSTGCVVSTLLAETYISVSPASYFHLHTCNFQFCPGCFHDWLSSCFHNVSYASLSFNVVLSPATASSPAPNLEVHASLNHMSCLIHTSLFLVGAVLSLTTKFIMISSSAFRTSNCKQVIGR